MIILLQSRESRRITWRQAAICSFYGPLGFWAVPGERETWWRLWHCETRPPTADLNEVWIPPHPTPFQPLHQQFYATFKGLILGKEMLYFHQKFLGILVPRSAFQGKAHCCLHLQDSLKARGEGKGAVCLWTMLPGMFLFNICSLCNKLIEIQILFFINTDFVLQLSAFQSPQSWEKHYEIFGHKSMRDCIVIYVHRWLIYAGNKLHNISW